MAITIAVIGAGAMGSAVAARLVTTGARVVTSLAGRGDASIARARLAGMVEVPEDTLASSDLILSIVPPGVAEAVVRQFAPLLARNSPRPIYLDCNALSPVSKRRLADLLGDVGCTMLDAAVIGGPPAPTGKGPAFYVSGKGADGARLLGDYGIDIRILDGPIGAAAALKMSYAGINKGLTALTTAMLLAAQRAGAGRELRKEMADSLPYLLARSRRSVSGMYPKAYRWIAEMREIASFLKDDPAAAMMFEGAAHFFEQCAADFASDRHELALLDDILGEADA